MKFSQELGTVSGSCIVTPKSGLSIVVPGSLRSLTHFVLREQNGWYDPEAEWLMKVVAPGSTVIDVGAGYGVYALSLAKAVGEMGTVWAFEPMTETREMLIESVKLNGIANLHVSDEAVSNHEGEETFHPFELPEFSSLIEIKTSKQVGFEVNTIALDPFFEREGIIKVDVLKISAMGAETLVLEGAKHLLETQSPLVIFKGRYGTTFNKASVTLLTQYGYAFYRLIPHLGVLARFNEPEGVDASWSILFACKADKALELEQRGFLENPKAVAVSSDMSKDVWKNFLKKLPYAKDHVQVWEKAICEKPLEDWDNYERALSLYAASRDVKVNRMQRLDYLRLALKHIQKACKTHTTLSRLQTLARLAYELGFKQLMSTSLEAILLMEKEMEQLFEEPFIPVNERYEQLSTRPDEHDWVLCEVLEQKEFHDHPSSYFSQKKSLETLKQIEQLGYADSAVRQRIHLLKESIKE